MLHVLLLVLKIILWIILSVIGLAILLLLVVLFAPIRYKADVSYQGGKTLQAMVKVRFLVVSFCVRLNQETGEKMQEIRLFGFRTGNKKSKRKNKRAKSEQNEIQSEEFDESELDKIQTEETDESELDKIQKNETEKQKSDVIQSDGIHLDEIQNKEIDEPKAEIEQTEEIDDVFDLDSDFDDIPETEKKASGRLKVFFTNIVAKIKNIWKSVEKYSPDKIVSNIQSKTEKVKKKIKTFQKFWNLSCTVKTRNYLKRYIPSIFKHIFPRQVKGYVHYGFDEPYKTGQITGYLSLMPFVYQKRLSLQPDFYEKVLDLHLILKGKIRIGYLIRIVLNINLWRTLKVAKKIMNQ